MGFEEDELNIEYGLRKNPQKTSRYSDFEDCSLKQQKLCQKCGKGFVSMKALHGHMRIHSGKRFYPKQKRVTSNKTEAPLKRRRSRRTRYKITNSSSISHQIEQDVEEGAIGLMMLSGVVRNQGGFNFVRESCGSNSLCFGAKPLHQYNDRADFNSMKSTLSNRVSIDSVATLEGHTQIHNNIGSSNTITKENHSLDNKTELKFPETDSTVHSTEKEARQMGYQLKKSVTKHACAICFHVFSSGQALGGHKRAHFAANSESNDSNTRAYYNSNFLITNSVEVEDSMGGLEGIRDEPLMGLICDWVS